ncbi:MAG: hypothetical protein PHY29_11475 [Syntrophales bacterium]|nr:hypothetical protein [Syntrophales bacterium]
MVAIVDDFKEADEVKIQPSTVDYPLSMTFTVCSSATANDGNIPFGDSISSAVVKAYDADGTDVTSDMVTTPASVDGTTVSYGISYYEGATSGYHKLTAVLTMASGYVDEFDLKKIWCGDR